MPLYVGKEHFETGPGCKCIVDGVDFVSKYFVFWINTDTEQVGVAEMNGKPMLQGELMSRDEEPGTITIDAPGMKFFPATEETWDAWDQHG